MGIGGLHHDLREGGIGQFRVEREHEARHALADIARDLTRLGQLANRIRSIRLTLASVVAKAEPAGRVTSTMSSGRSEFGKNCCSTLPMATTASAKTPP